MSALYNDDPPGYPYSTKTRAEQLEEALDAANRRVRKLELAVTTAAILAAVVGFLAGLAI